MSDDRDPWADVMDVIPSTPAADPWADVMDVEPAKRAKPLGPVKPEGNRGKAKSTITPGNIDLHDRPVVKNPDGSISTVRSKSFEIDGREVLLPTISDDGRNLTDEQALDQYRQTGRHLGKFPSPESATSYAKQLHEDQAREYASQHAEPARGRPGRVSAVSPHSAPFDPYGGYFSRTDRGQPEKAADDPRWTMAESLGASLGEDFSLPSGEDWFNSLRGTLARQMQGYELGEYESMKDEMLGRTWPIGRDGMPKYSRTPAELREVQDDPLMLALDKAIGESRAAGQEITAEGKDIAARNTGFWPQAVMSGTNSLAATALPLGMTILGKDPRLAMPFMYGPTKFGAYGEMRENDVPIGLADKASTIEGITEVLTEFPAMSPFAQEFSPLLQRLGETLAADIPGELIANEAQTVTRKIAEADPNAPLLDPIAEGMRESNAQIPQTLATTFLTAGAHGAISELAQVPGKVRDERLDRNANVVRDDALASAQNLLNMIRGPQGKLPFDGTAQPPGAPPPPGSPPGPPGLGSPPSQQPTIDTGLLSSLVPQDPFAPELPIPDTNIQPPLPLGSIVAPASTGSPAPEAGAARASAPVAPPTPGTASPLRESEYAAIQQQLAQLAPEDRESFLEQLAAHGHIGRGEIAALLAQGGERPLSSALQQPAATVPATPPAPAPAPNKPASTPAPQAKTADSTAQEQPAGGGATVSFTTEKGSTYEVGADGTTTRTKAARPEHPGDEGPQEPSQATYYLTKEQADILAEIQTQGGKVRRAIAPFGDGQIGIKYLSGPQKGGFESRTIVKPATQPAVGLTPLELWKDGTIRHFGNKITEVRGIKQPRPISKWTDEELEQAAQQHDIAAQDSERMKDPGRAAKFREGAATLRAQKGKQAKPAEQPAKETPAPAKEAKAEPATAPAREPAPTKVHRGGPTPFVPVTPLSTLTDSPAMYHETSADNLRDLVLADDRTGYRSKLYVTDDLDLAIGQGGKGITITYRTDGLSGKENEKPGTGIIGGREYVVEGAARHSITTIDVKNGASWNKIPTNNPSSRASNTKRMLQGDFDETQNADGSVTLTRKSAQPAQAATPTPTPAKETRPAKPPGPQIGMFGEQGEPTAEAKEPETPAAAGTLVLPPPPKPPKKTTADAKKKRNELTKEVEALWEDYKRIKPALAKDHAYLHGKTVDAINDLQRDMREAKDWDRYGYRLDDLRDALRTAVERVEPPKKPLDPDATYPKPEGPVRETVPHVAQPGTDAGSGGVAIEATKDDFAEVINEHAQLFAEPDVKVLATHHPDKSNPLTPEEADKRVQVWMDHAFAQTMDEDQRSRNMGRTVLSLFDLTGMWSQPYMDAGYNVVTVDLQNGHDIRDFSVEYIQENWPDVVDVYAILIAAPCTDFASSGALHFGKKDASGETEASKELVFQALRTVEYFRPVVWALENPTGRIERLTGLPPARYSFDPSDFSEPYTKKTHLWGKFSTDLPVAPVEPTRGSKIHSEFGGKSQETKNARSETPEGFAYAFFMANNAEDSTAQERLVGEFPMAAGAIEKALEAGFSEAQIRKVMEESDYDPGSGDAPKSQEALRKLVKTGKPKPEPKAKVTPPPTAEQLAKKYKKVPAEAFQRAQDLGLNLKAIDFYMRHQDTSDRTLETFEKYVLAVEMTKPGNYPYLNEPPLKPEKEEEGQKKKRRPTPKEAAKTKEDFGKTIGRHLPEWSWRKVPLLAAGSPEAKQFAADIDKGVQAVRDTYEIKDDEQRYWDYAKAISDLRATVESALEAVRGKGPSSETAADETETDDVDEEATTQADDEEVTDIDEDIGITAAEESFAPEPAEFNLPDPPPPRTKGAKRSSAVEKQVRQNLANAEQLHEEWTQLDTTADWAAPFHDKLDEHYAGMRNAKTYAEWAKHVAEYRATLTQGIEEAQKHTATKTPAKKTQKAASKDSGIEASSLDAPDESTDTEGSSRTAARGDVGFTPPSTPRENLMNEVGIDPTTFRLLGGKEQWKVAVDALKQKYGFAGIFKHPAANWRDSVDHLLDAFESLQNMAEVMGQGNKVVSLGGKVHLYMREKPGKFGGYYRHKGGMSGEPDRTIAIFKQADVFSHELGHALDYDLMEQAGGTEAGGLSRMLRAHEPNAGLPATTMEAFANVITSLYYDAGDIAIIIKKVEHQLSKAKTPKRQAELKKRLDNLRSGAWTGRGSKTQFYQRAKDGPLKDYLSKPTELFARAHEAYISWKIQSQNARGLVKFLGKPDAIYRNDADAWIKRIYPQAMDRANIFAAFDNLYGQIARENAYDTSNNPGWANSQLNQGLIDPVAQAKANGTPLTPDIIAAKNLTRKAASTYAEDELARNDTIANNITRLMEDIKNGVPGSMDKWHAFRKSFASTPDGIFKFLEMRFPDLPALRAIRDNLSDAHIHGRNKPVGVYREMQRAEHAITNRMEDRLAAVAIRRNMPKEWTSRMWDILHGHEQPVTAEERLQADAIRYEFDYHWKMRDQTGEKIGYVEYEYLPRVLMRNVADDKRFHEQLTKLRVAEKKALIEKLANDLKHTQDPEKRAAIEAKQREADKLDPLARAREQIAAMKGLQWGEPVYLGALSSDSGKERVFGPLADKMLKDYYIKDPFTLLAGYGAAAARGKVMRDRFGGKPNAQFDEWLNAVATELPSAYSDLLVNAMQVSLGIRRDGNGVVSRAVNAYTNVTVSALMGRSVIPNLSEPLNNLSKSLGAGATSVRLMKAMLPFMRNEKDKVRFATADRFGRLSGTLVDAASSMTAMAQALGEDVQGNGILARFSMRAYWYNLTSGLTAWQEKITNRIAFESFYEAARMIRKGGPDAGMYRTWLKEYGISDPVAFAEFLKDHTTVDDLAFENTLEGMGRSLANASAHYTHTTIQKPTPSTKLIWSHNPIIGAMARLSSWITTNATNWRDVLVDKTKSAWTGKYGEETLTSKQRMQAMVYPVAAAAISMYIGQATFLIARMLLTNPEEWEDRGDDFWDRFWSRKTQIQIIQYWGVLGWLMNTTADLVAGSRFNRGPVSTILGPSYGSAEQDAERLLTYGVDQADVLLLGKVPSNAARNNAAQAVIHNATLLALVALLTTLPASKKPAIVTGFLASFYGTSPQFQHYLADLWAGEKTAVLRRRAAKGDREARHELRERTKETRKAKHSSTSTERPKS